MYKDPNGKASAIRVILLFTTFVIFSTWSAICIFAAFYGIYILPDIPIQVNLAFLGLITGKVAQRILIEK